MTIHSLRTVVILILLFSIVGCGFKLRGDLILPDYMEATYIQTPYPYNQLTKTLRKRLLGLDIQVVADKTKASAILAIHRDQLRKNILTVSDQGKVREFRLNYEVEFSLNKVNEATKNSRILLTISRDVVFDETQVLSHSKEEELIRNIMYDEMAGQVLQRLEQFSL